MEKYINIVLPDILIDSLSFQHGFTISRIGYYEEPREHYIERDDLDDAVLMLCLNGSGYVEYKGKKYTTHRGDIAFLEPHTPHKYGAHDDDRWTIIWVHFRGEGMPELLSLFKRFGFNNIFHLENYQTVADELNNIILLLRNYHESLHIHKACCMLEMILLRFFESDAYQTAEDSRYIGEAIRFMQAHVRNNLNLQAISEHLGISTYHTIRIFKAAVMATPMQYYNTLRINESVRLLLSTERSIAEISQELHYSSPFHFSQQFKKKMGVSPASYKKLMSNKY